MTPSTEFADASPLEERASAMERLIAVSLFFALLLVNVAIIDLRVSDFPVRAAAAVVLLGAVTLIYPERTLQVVQRHSMLLWLTAGFAFLGIFVSFANGTSFDLVWQGVMEIPLQVAVTLVVTSVLVQIAGTRASMWAFVAVVGGSAFVAVLQFLGFDGAWQLREWLGSLQNATPSTPLINRRPMGVSFSPIQLSTQLCLAFAVFAAARDHFRNGPVVRPSADPMILVALLVLVVGSVVSLTRSPILGGAVFMAIYIILRPGSWLLFLGLIGGVAVYLVGPMVIELMQENAPRVVRAGDNSVMARISMNMFGLMLFADNPLGYGYAFTPYEYSTKFWQELYLTPHPTATTDKELHNYVLNMLNTYGIGLLLLMPLVIALLRRAGRNLIFFIPYIVHILFHNSGPFWTDVPFWFAVAVLSGIGPALGERRSRLALDSKDARAYAS